MKHDNKTIALFANEINVDINQVDAVINDCLNENMFSKSHFKDYNILTSKSIQNNYLEAVRRRKEVVFIKEYVLFDIDINLVNVVINSINSDKSTQSRVEYSRVEESKVEESRGKEIPPPQIEENLIPLEKKEKSPPSSENPPIAENFVLNKDFTKAWNILIKMPKWAKKPQESIQTALESIQKFDDEFALMLVNIAIEGDYQGLIYPNTEVDYQKWKNLRSLNKGKKTITDYWEEHRNESA
jgi:hypothetical protein